MYTMTSELDNYCIDREGSCKLYDKIKITKL